mgnify:CR=1 FL=1
MIKLYCYLCYGEELVKKEKQTGDCKHCKLRTLFFPSRSKARQYHVVFDNIGKKVFFQYHEQEKKILHNFTNNL